MSKKIMAMVTAITVVLGLGLTGCSNNSSTKDEAGSNAKDKKATVTFWAAAVTPERDKFFQDFAQKAHEQYPNITVDYLGVPGDLNAYRQKLDMAIAADQAPDITNDFRADLITRNYYESLDSYFDKWADKDKISPAAVKSNRTVDNKESKLYALPYGLQAWNIWLRSDWFKEANLDTPTTWDQFFDDAKKLTDKSKGRFGLSIRGGGGSANTLEMLMYSYSGISNYYTADGKSTINDPLNVEFVEKYLGMYNVCTPEDDLGKGWTELAATFQSGKAAMVVHNLGSASSHEQAFGGDKSKFAAIPFPKSVKGYVQEPAFTPLGLSMAKTAKDKDATWNVMSYYLSKDINSSYGKIYGEIPANKDAASATWINDLPYMKMGAQLLTSSDTHFGTNPYYLPGYTNIQGKTIEPLIQKVMAKKMTAKDMLDTWAGALEKEKADFDAAGKK
jgi:multiple sugar transport system substrate-binding protein